MIAYWMCNAEQNKRLNATSDFADYELLKPLICCGWMACHTDDHDADSVKTYKLKVHYIHHQAVFIYKGDNGYELTELKAGDILEFKQRKMHGLIPRSLAKEIVKRKTIRFTRYNKWDYKITGNSFKPKLIWEWVK